MIAICARAGSFTDRWISECDRRGISYIIVDMLSPDLIDTLKANIVEVMLAHPPMYDRAAQLAASAVIKACEVMGVRVFPGSQDYWHFDDKIAQSYIFSALDVKTPKTHVLYDKRAALEWVQCAKFPLVFKLKSGAGSINVHLVRDLAHAQRIVQRMFAKGYAPASSATTDLATKIRNRRTRADWLGVASRAPATILNMLRLRKSLDWERGYVLFQEFIPNNNFDTRVTVIGDRAFAFRRKVRPGDFRASGSGDIDYDPSAIDLRAIELAHATTRQLGASCLAFDFVEDPVTRSPLIIEMSYAFMAEAVFECSGHWSRDLQWKVGHQWPQDAILDDLLTGCRR